MTKRGKFLTRDDMIAQSGNPLLIYGGIACHPSKFPRQTLPQPTLTDEEKAEVRAASQAAMSAFRAKLRLALRLPEIAGEIERGDGTEFFAFQVESSTADRIEKIAAERGITPADFVAEAMRVAMWRYRFADGIKVVEAGSLTPAADSVDTSAVVEKSFLDWLDGATPDFS